MMIREVHAAPGMEFAVEYTDQAHGYHAFVVIHSTVTRWSSRALLPGSW